MKKIFLILLFVSAVSYSQWVIKETNSAYNFNCVIMKNSVYGFATSNYPPQSACRVYRTQDTGESWYWALGTGGTSMKSVCFADTSNVVICRYDGHSYSVDLGQHWYTHIINVQFEDACFVNATTGYMISNSPSNTVYLSTDGGEWWSSYSLILGGNKYYSINFPNISTGILTGNYGVVSKTTNAGLNWSPLPTNINDTLFSACTLSDNVYFAAGSNSTLIKTTNGGNNWQSLSIGQQGISLRSVYFINSLTGYICGSGGYIAKTTDSGNFWTSQNSSTNVMLHSIYFLNNDTGFACGDNGVILKTKNGGVIGIKKITNAIPTEIKLYQNYPNPFNPSTKIQFALLKSSFARLIVYDALGKEVETLVSEQLTAGTYEADWNTDKFSSGVYYYKLTAGDYTETKKMVLMK